MSDDDVDDDDWTAGAERQSDRGGGSCEGGNGGSLGGNGGGAGGTGNKNGRRRHKKDKNSPKRKKWKNGASSSVVDPAPAHTPGMLDSGGSLPAGTTHPFSIHLNDLGQSSNTTLGPSGINIPLILVLKCVVVRTIHNSFLNYRSSRWSCFQCDDGRCYRILNCRTHPRWNGRDSHDGAIVYHVRCRVW